MTQPVSETEEIVKLTDADAPAAARPGVLFVSARGVAYHRAVALRGSKQTLTLGRASTNDVVLEDTSVSSKHAEVSFDGMRWAIRDLGSRNGTFVDAVRVKDTTSTTAMVLRLGECVLLLRRDLGTTDGPEDLRDGEMIVGPTLRPVVEATAKYGRVADSLLILAERGAGKEHFAKIFHQRGKRASGPYVAIPAGKSPSDLSASLFFGTTKGVHSKADKFVPGYFHNADHGTLFLDEIARMSLDVQGMLLRALQERVVVPVGASFPTPVDVGVVAATNEDIDALMDRGEFRRDFYDRLATMIVRIPPLRDRREEISWLLAQKIERFNEEGRRVAPEFVERALLYDWPGNVRELENVAQRASHDVRYPAELHPANIPIPGRDVAQPVPAPPPAPEPERVSSRPVVTADSIERETITTALNKNRWHKANTAKDLGISRTTLDAKLKKHGLE